MAIDINSGKFVGKKDFETSALEVNLEAVDEIAKQMRLRDLGGIIIVDCIDMVNPESKQKVIDEMNKKIKDDRTKVQVTEMSKLCLLELTRKPIFGRNT